MNTRQKYRVYSERENEFINHECTMGQQRINEDDLHYLTQLQDKYTEIIKYHTTIMRSDSSIQNIESKLAINFEDTYGNNNGK